MKLATYRDGSRDGQLVVVSRDLSVAHYASGIATRLQQLLDDWNFLSPQLEDLSVTLNHGRARHAFPFEPALCMAPLPRAFRWARAARTPGIADDFCGCRDPIAWPGAAVVLGAEPGLAAICGDIAAGAAPDAALEGVRLVMLSNDICIAAENGAPVEIATAFSPVAVTHDELGPAWQGGRLHLDLHATRNGRRRPSVAVAAAMRAPFGDLIAEEARWRGVRAGSIVGSGALMTDEPAEPLRLGDALRLDVRGSDGNSVFGAIDQCVEAAILE